MVVCALHAMRIELLRANRRLIVLALPIFKDEGENHSKTSGTASYSYKLYSVYTQHVYNFIDLDLQRMI